VPEPVLKQFLSILRTYDHSKSLSFFLRSKGFRVRKYRFKYFLDLIDFEKIPVQETKQDFRFSECSSIRSHLELIVTQGWYKEGSKFFKTAPEQGTGEIRLFSSLDIKRATPSKITVPILSDYVAYHNKRDIGSVVINVMMEEVIIDMMKIYEICLSLRNSSSKIKKEDIPHIQDGYDEVWVYRADRGFPSLEFSLSHQPNHPFTNGRNLTEPEFFALSDAVSRIHPTVFFSCMSVLGYSFDTFRISCKSMMFKKNFFGKRQDGYQGNILLRDRVEDVIGKDGPWYLGSSYVQKHVIVLPYDTMVLDGSMSLEVPINRTLMKGIPYNLLGLDSHVYSRQYVFKYYIDIVFDGPIKITHNCTKREKEKVERILSAGTHYRIRVYLDNFFQYDESFVLFPLKDIFHNFQFFGYYTGKVFISLTTYTSRYSTNEEKYLFDVHPKTIKDYASGDGKLVVRKVHGMYVPLHTSDFLIKGGIPVEYNTIYGNIKVNQIEHPKKIDYGKLDIIYKLTKKVMDDPKGFTQNKLIMRTVGYNQIRHTSNRIRREKRQDKRRSV